jgi:hypothetical protein
MKGTRFLIHLPREPSGDASRPAGEAVLEGSPSAVSPEPAGPDPGDQTTTTTGRTIGRRRNRS